MVYDILAAVIGSYIVGWLILSAVHAVDRRQARKHRATLEKKLTARGQTMADWDQTKEASQSEYLHR